jgi:hypothetical protein
MKAISAAPPAFVPNTCERETELVSGSMCWDLAAAKRGQEVRTWCAVWSGSPHSQYVVWVVRGRSESRGLFSCECVCGQQSYACRYYEARVARQALHERRVLPVGGRREG